MNTVTFKFDVGEEIYFLANNQITKSKIATITYCKSESGHESTSFSVKIADEDGELVTKKLYVGEFFKTKKELIKYLESLDI